MCEDVATKKNGGKGYLEMLGANHTPVVLLAS